MRRRNFAILLAAAAAMVVLAVVVVTRGDGDVSRAPGGERALPGFANKLGSLDFLRLTRGSTTINFKHSDQTWTVVEKGGYPADQERVRKLLLQLAELELVEPKTDRPELLPRLDLDDPANGKSTEITAQDRAGTLAAQLIIGRARPSDIEGGQAGVYARKPGTNQSGRRLAPLGLSGAAARCVATRATS